MHQPTLRTKRLLLRPYRMADANDVQQLAGNPNVSKQTINIPYPYGSGVAQAWISTHKENWELRRRATFALVCLETNKLIGTAGFVRNDGDVAELGYWIGESFWGKGYCTEACCELIRLAFNVLNLNSVVARHLTSNPASGKVMQKAGMHYLKTTRQLGRFDKLVSLDMYVIRNVATKSQVSSDTQMK